MSTPTDLTFAELEDAGRSASLRAHKEATAAGLVVAGRTVPDHSRSPSSGLGDLTWVSLEAEQAVLGALLFDNDVLSSFNGLTSAHFSEPVHGRLYDLVTSLIASDQLAEPIVVAAQLQADAAFRELGGVRYLADLIDRAPPTSHSTTFAALVQALGNVRQLAAESDRQAENVSEPMSLRRA